MVTLPELEQNSFSLAQNSVKLVSSRFYLHWNWAYKSGTENWFEWRFVVLYCNLSLLSGIRRSSSQSGHTSSSQVSYGFLYWRNHPIVFECIVEVVINKKKVYVFLGCLRRLIKISIIFFNPIAASVPFHSVCYSVVIKIVINIAC